MIFNIEALIFEISFSIPLHQYNNLISFYVLPEDNTVSSVMLDVQDNISAVFGEGVSAQYYQESNSWQGALIDLDIASGYWLRMEDSDTLDAFGYPINPGRVYNLHEGANLVSFPIPGSVSISEGFPDDIEDNIIAILGEGYSALHSDGVWTGALMDFEGLHGYWIITDADISFSYDLESATLSRQVNPYVTNSPSGFEFAQSTQQAFYFVEQIKLIENEVKEGDLLISYCGNTLSGTRSWLGTAVDIPVMGDEGNYETAEYCEAGDIPHFKLLQSDTQELISLHGNISNWESNGVFQMGILYESAPLPSEFKMDSAYPNPFNPITNISFQIPVVSQIDLSIMNIKGQKIETLINQIFEPGNYTIKWNASEVASGVYFIHFNASENNTIISSHIQKIMLVK